MSKGFPGWPRSDIISFGAREAAQWQCFGVCNPKTCSSAVFGHLNKVAPDLLVSLLVGFPTLGLNNWPRKRAFNVVVFLTRIAFPNIYLGDKIGVMAIRFTRLLNKSQITTAGFLGSNIKGRPNIEGSRWNATARQCNCLLKKLSVSAVFYLNPWRLDKTTHTEHTNAWVLALNCNSVFLCCQRLVLCRSL